MAWWVSVRCAWELVSAGTRLLAVVPLQQTYITANYLETQLADVRPGQRVVVKIDALPGKTFTGHVDSIAPATGATFSAIAPITPPATTLKWFSVCR